MSQRTFLSAKIHGATITCAKLEYHGSLSIDPQLMKGAGILPFERIDIYNLDNGERLSTYAIPGGPGEICMNGAAAHKGSVGQRLIIAAYQTLDETEMVGTTPKVVIVGPGNTVEETIDYTINTVF